MAWARDSLGAIPAMSYAAVAQGRDESRDQSAPPQVLVPFDPREAIGLKQAAALAGKSEATLRSWCALYDIGRRVAGGSWMISRIALAMFLDGDKRALRAYLHGDRSSEIV